MHALSMQNCCNQHILFDRLVIPGNFVAGLSSTVAMGASSLLSNTWFPVSERTTATSIAAQSNVFGVATTYIAGKIKCTSSRTGNQWCSVNN